MGGTRTLAEVTAADFDAMVAANLRAPFLLAQRTLPGMGDPGIRPDPADVVGGRVHRRRRGLTRRRI